MGKTYKNRDAVKGKKSKKPRDYDENYNVSLKYEKREQARTEKLNTNWVRDF